ncbi:MAG: type II toxin-antitoxin system PemK/MazF family toxin [Candidatus Acidiferrales bacterium]|jgi:mRNA-degrading endonuclease toxin of MazEF toxin-antitoxin module
MASPASPRRGEVYLVDLDKPRPAIILSVDALNRHALDICVVPITTKTHAQFTMRVPLKKGDGGLDRDCWAKCDQVTTLEKADLQTRPLGALSPLKLQQIEDQVRVALGI